LPDRLILFVADRKEKGSCVVQGSGETARAWPARAKLPNASTAPALMKECSIVVISLGLGSPFFISGTGQLGDLYVIHLSKKHSEPIRQNAANYRQIR
jgi:hypothetical protein